MNKKEIINTLNKYNFNTNEYIVIAGAAMVLLGLKKETHDIDITVTPNYYEYLKNNYDCKLEWCNGDNEVYFIDDIINFGKDYYNNNYLLIDGIRVQHPKDIIKMKKVFNRSKDLEDIQLLEKYMEEL